MKASNYLLLPVFCLLASCTAFAPPKPIYPSREGITPGETVTVHGNENVYAIAQRHHVSMRDLIVLNNMHSPFVLHDGDKVVLPAGSTGDGASSSFNPPDQAPTPSLAGVSPVEETTLPPIQTMPPQVQSAPLAPPTQYSNAPKSLAGTSSSKAPPSAEVLTTPSPVKSMPTTAASPSAGQVAAAVAPAAQPPADAPSLSLAWPVQGPVLSGFGPKGQGLNNDGVNIGAPKGAPVVAAASGVVVYAGNEMKGFGNLILIRHQGGWVTAYAHLDRTLVGKDAVVAQGDEIGTVGKTGNVDKPQLHFETRYQGKAVDPNSVIKAQ